MRHLILNHWAKYGILFAIENIHFITVGLNL